MAKIEHKKAKILKKAVAEEAKKQKESPAKEAKEKETLTDKEEEAEDKDEMEKDGQGGCGPAYKKMKKLAKKK